MNDFSELERELKKLRPAPPSDALMQRIETALAQPETPTAAILPRKRQRTNGWWSFGLGLTGVAALLVIGLTFFDRTPLPTNVAALQPTATAGAVSGFEPVGLTQVVYSGRDEGIVFSPNECGIPRRRVSYETRETMHWRNPKTGASVRLSYPAEQVVLTPVSFQ
jgi:hypothetical protein